MDWSQIAAAAIISLPGLVGAFLARGARNEARDVRRDLETPSGDRIGEVVERSHDLVAAGTHAFLDRSGPHGEP